MEKQTVRRLAWLGILLAAFCACNWLFYNLQPFGWNYMHGVHSGYMPGAASQSGGQIRVQMQDLIPPYLRVVQFVLFILLAGWGALGPEHALVRVLRAGWFLAVLVVAPFWWLPNSRYGSAHLVSTTLIFGAVVALVSFLLWSTLRVVAGWRLLAQEDARGLAKAPAKISLREMFFQVSGFALLLLYTQTLGRMDTVERIFLPNRQAVIFLGLLAIPLCCLVAALTGLVLGSGGRRKFAALALAAIAAAFLTWMSASTLLQRANASPPGISLKAWMSREPVIRLRVYAIQDKPWAVIAGLLVFAAATLGSLGLIRRAGFVLLRRGEGGVSQTAPAEPANLAENSVRREARALTFRGVAAFAVVAVLLAGLNLLPMAIEGPGRNIYEGYNAGLYLVEPMLLGLWLFLPPFSWRVQLLSSGMIAATWLVTGFMGYASRVQLSSSRDFGYPIIIEGGFFAGTALAAFYLRRVRGWRLVPHGWSCAIPPGRPVRFSLRQMLIATTVVAVLLTLRRFEEPFRIAVMTTVIGFSCLLPLVPTLVLLLGSRRRRLTTWLDPALLAVTPLIVWTFFRYTGWPPAVFQILGIWFAASVGTFFWLRLSGFRLVSAATANRENEAPGLTTTGQASIASPS